MEQMGIVDVRLPYLGNLRRMLNTRMRVRVYKNSRRETRANRKKQNIWRFNLGISGRVKGEITFLSVIAPTSSPRLESILQSLSW